MTLMTLITQPRLVGLVAQSPALMYFEVNSVSSYPVVPVVAGYGNHASGRHFLDNVSLEYGLQCLYFARACGRVYYVRGLGINTCTALCVLHRVCKLYLV